MAVTKLKSFIVWDWRPITNYLILLLHVGHAYSTYGPTVGGHILLYPLGVSVLYPLGGCVTPLPPKVPVLVVCCQPLLHTLSYVEARDSPPSF